MPEDAVPRQTDEAGSIDQLMADSERSIAENCQCTCGEGTETKPHKHGPYCEFREEWDRQILANEEVCKIRPNHKATKKKKGAD